MKSPRPIAKSRRRTAKPPRRTAYALIYLLAALPIVVVIGNTTVRLVGQGLRAQRVAAREAVVADARRSIVEQLRRDAAAAVAVAADQDAYGAELTLRAPDAEVAYLTSNGAVTRVVKAGATEQQRQTWRLVDTTIGFQWEPVSEQGGVVWIRFHHTLTIDQRFPTRRELATAIRVQTGGGR